MAVQLEQSVQPGVGDATPRLDELAQMIRAYNDVTEKLQHSHEKLENEVLRLRRELASTNAQLQRSKRLSALGEMAAGIAHEIRNPLAAIQLYVAMIVEDLSGSELRPDIAVENARKVASAVRGLNAIVNDVLSFARETRPQPVATTAAALFDRVLDAHRPAIESARVRVERDGAAEQIELRVDPQLMHQALLNLVRNAVEVMESAENRVLTLHARAEAEAAVLTVSDTGPGIDESDIDRIFNPFFTTRNTGTGLGLAIVHRIIDAHGGSIAVQNEPGAGAVFRLFLPRETGARAATECDRPDGVAA